jgi:hypothetical protein
MDVLGEQKYAGFADVTDWRHLESEWCMFEAGPGYGLWVQSLLKIKGLKVGPNLDGPCSLYCQNESDSDLSEDELINPNLSTVDNDSESGLSEDELINPNLNTVDNDSESGLSEDELLPPASDLCILCQ